MCAVLYKPKIVIYTIFIAKGLTVFDHNIQKTSNCIDVCQNIDRNGVVKRLDVFYVRQRSRH